MQFHATTANWRSPIYISEGAGFLGVLYGKGGSPKKGGTLGFPTCSFRKSSGPVLVDSYRFSLHSPGQFSQFSPGFGQF